MGRNFLLASVDLRRRLIGWRGLQLGGMIFSDAALVSGGPFHELKREWYQDLGAGFRVGLFGRQLLEVLFGVDLKTSAHAVWVGLPR
ncbi:MAG: hypothetical protein ACE5JX_06790 [Acidobacteriota bacterium]